MVSHIEVFDLKKTYQTFKKAEGLSASIKSLFIREKLAKDAVKGITFSIPPGELVGFLGPNGAGKTTTMKMLTGILHPTGGDARVLGRVPWRRETELLKRIALVMGQKAQLWWDLPAADSFLLNRDIYEVPEARYRERLKELTELFELTDLLHVPVRNLSLGERMKCELTACLLHSPDILFLDEPTIGLDMISQRKLRSFLKAYNQEHGLTVLLTSHYMQDIKELCNRVIVINHGAIVYDGSIKDLMLRYSGLSQARITWAEPLADQSSIQLLKERLQTLGDVKVIDRWSAQVDVQGIMGSRLAGAVSDLAPVESVEVQEADIEIVMERLFGEGVEG